MSNINELKPLISLNPFARFCCTIGNLPSSYMASLTYEEQLLWFCDYLQNTIIPAVNNNAEVVKELQELYVELKNYVDNYFKNLDLQNEINNKLDKMAQNGELKNLIITYFQPQINLQNNLIENIENKVNLQDKNIENINNKVNSAVSGSPFVVSSIEEMTDTNHIYVNTSNGHWYYFNNEWIDGGVYQATEDSDTLINLQNDMKKITTNFDLSFGKTFNATISSQIRNDNYGYCVPYYSPKDRISKIKYYGSVLTPNSNITCIINGRILSDRFKLGEKSILITENDVLNSPKWFDFDFNDIDTSNYDIIEIYILSNEEFITRFTDNANNLSNITAISSDYPIYYKASANQGNLYSYTTNNNFIPFIEIFTKDVKVGFDNLTTDIKNDLNNFNNHTIDFGISLFNSAGACGDSFTHGTTGNSNGDYISLGSSWFDKMCNRSGIPFANYGIGGATTKSWLINPNGLPKLLQDTPKDFYFIGFGINDSSSLGINYLGTIYDITENYENNPDTFYGNYARIIEQILNYSPNAKLVLLPIWYPWNHQYKSEFNNAIKSIANHYNIIYIDIFEDWFFNSSIYRDMTNSHPSPISYDGMSFAMERLLNKAIKNNYNYFKYSNVG